MPSKSKTGAEADAEPVAEAEPAAQESKPDDLPGKMPEPAAPSGAEPEPTPGIAPLGQGAQVVLTGDAQAAARGGTHGDITANTIARDAAIAGGHIEPATAEAAVAATTSALDPLADEEDEAIAKVKAEFAAKRIERAKKPE